MAGENMMVGIGDLRQFLTDYKSQIDYVCLTWIWEETAIIESNYMGRVNGCLQPLYYEFDYDRIDEDYSFFGNVEDAIEFAENYDCWNGSELYCEDGIVAGEIRERGSEHDYTRDIFNYGVNIDYIGLVYYYYDSKGNSKTSYYIGKPERVKK